MATTAERLGIVETKVHNLAEKLDDLKVNVKDMHDCLDRTRDTLSETLTSMRTESSSQHDSLAAKISELEKFRFRWTYMVAGAIAMLGIMSGHIDKIEKFFK